MASPAKRRPTAAKTAKPSKADQAGKTPKAGKSSKADQPAPLDNPSPVAKPSSAVAAAPGQKVDLYAEHKAEYAATPTPALVKVSPAHYLTVYGRGDPDGETFATKVAAIYSVAYTVKMSRKFAGLGDYKVCGLEGLWWIEGQESAASSSGFNQTNREQWSWQLLIRTPAFVTNADLEAARDRLLKKAKDPTVAEVILQTLQEGLCVQALHLGPYAGEPVTIAAMERFMAAQGLAAHGRHHEIYLSDPRRVAPERLRTILRHPVRKA